MGFKSLFVKEDDGFSEEKIKEVSNQTAKTSAAPNKVSSLTSATQTPYVAPVVISNEEKNEFTTFISDIYKKGNFPGPDYQELDDAVKAMDSLPIDEKTKFNTAFAILKTQGITKSRLIDTAGKYIVMINEQTSLFGKKIDDIMKSEVADKQKQLESINKENAEIEKQMIALNEKKNKNNETISVVSNEIATKVSTLNVKKTSFEAAAADFVGRVQKNIQNINDYLPA